MSEFIAIQTASLNACNNALFSYRNVTMMLRLAWSAENQQALRSSLSSAADACDNLKDSLSDISDAPSFWSYAGISNVDFALQGLRKAWTATSQKDARSYITAAAKRLARDEVLLTDYIHSLEDSIESAHDADYRAQILSY